MKAGRGHLKGSRFEREVAKKLSLWVSNGRRDDVFWRTAMSGGRATIGLKTGVVRTAQAGDIAAIDAMARKLLLHVIIECKSYSDLQIARGLLNDTGLLREFWFEHKEQGVKFNKYPMLIARQNGLSTFCLLQRRISEGLFGLTTDYMLADLPRWDCCIILFDRFLSDAKIPTLKPFIVSPVRVRLS